MENIKILTQSELQEGYWVGLKLKNIDDLIFGCVSNAYFLFSDSYAIDKNSNEIEQIFAIPLSYEHLLKLEFKPVQDYDNLFRLYIGNNCIEAKTDVAQNIKIRIIEEDNERYCHCDYVHELQAEIYILKSNEQNLIVT